MLLITAVSDPHPEISKGGGGGGAVSKKFLSTRRPSVWSKNKGGGGGSPGVPPLDPSLLQAWGKGTQDSLYNWFECHRKKRKGYFAERGTQHAERRMTEE